MSDKEILISLFQERLPTILPNYEDRKEQIEMAVTISDCLASQKNLLIEAGTGVGKSLAYLLPFLLYAKRENKKVAVSTYTKILQEQLIKKDIPLVKELVSFKASICYGQDNYICRRRSRNNLRYGLFDTGEEKYFKDKIAFWAEEKKGLIVDFPENIDAALLSKINRDSDNCRGENCEFYNDCFYYQAKREWAAADLLIINHSLFFAHCAASYKLLPQFDVILFDEAHRLEEAGVGYFGIDLSNYGLKKTLSLLYNPWTKKGFLNQLRLPLPAQEVIRGRIERLRQLTDNFFFEIHQKLEPRKRILSPPQLSANLGYELEGFNTFLIEILKEIKEEEFAFELRSIIRSLKRKEAMIKEFIALKDSGAVYWIEREEEHICLKSAPLSIREVLEDIFAKFKAVILTSATLTVARDFSFITNRLGIRSAEKKILDSPFDYPRQSLLFIDDRLPPPTPEREFIPKCARAIDEIIKIAHGRTLVLFTSFRMLEEIFSLVENRRYRLLKQGDKPVYKLLEEFRQDTTSCLFATASFWQGIDVPGEALSCLIITRLPFDVPDEPRIEGIVEDLRKRGIEPFYAFQLPQAILRFRQGFGRLIRNKNDRGVVCVLDKRIIRRSYGSLFLKSLPENIPMTLNISPVVGFFRTHSPGKSERSGTQAPNVIGKPS